MAIGGTAAAWAQDAAEDETAEQLLACDDIADQAEKLECFNSVVNSLKDSPAAPQAESPSATAADPVTPRPAEPATTTPAMPAASTPGATVPAAVAAPAAAATATTTTSPAAADSVPIPDDSPAATTGSPVDPIDDFGRDSMQSKAEEEKEEEKEKEILGEMRALIVRSWRHNDGRFSVELDNGQIWRETTGSRVAGPMELDMTFGGRSPSSAGLPREGNSVEVFEGRFGGYRMRIEGIRQLAHVRRTK
jgi:hypothetical protein